MGKVWGQDRVRVGMELWLRCSSFHRYNGGVRAEILPHSQKRTQ